VTAVNTRRLTRVLTDRRDVIEAQLPEGWKLTRLSPRFVARYCVDSDEDWFLYESGLDVDTLIVRCRARQKDITRLSEETTRLARRGTRKSSNPTVAQEIQ
jgi:hypothetical protein